MLEVKQVKHLFKDGTPLTFPDFTLKAGEALCLIGPSGKGKSTLLHLITALLPLQSGNIRIDGQSLSSISTSEQNALRANKMALVLQSSPFISGLRLMENMRLVCKNPHIFDAEYAYKVLEQLNITHLKNKDPKNFSGGERQRAALAIALSKKPKLLLADEPSANLDDSNTLNMAQLLLTLPQQFNTALLVVSHDARLKNHFKHILSL